MHRSTENDSTASCRHFTAVVDDNMTTQFYGLRPNVRNIDNDAFDLLQFATCRAICVKYNNFNVGHITVANLRNIKANTPHQ